jgi:hypothetical protein
MYIIEAVLKSLNIHNELYIKHTFCVHLDKQEIRSSFLQQFFDTWFKINKVRTNWYNYYPWEYCNNEVMVPGIRHIPVISNLADSWYHNLIVKVFPYIVTMPVLSIIQGYLVPELHYHSIPIDSNYTSYV